MAVYGGLFDESFSNGAAGLGGMYNNQGTQAQGQFNRSAVKEQLKAQALELLARYKRQARLEPKRIPGLCLEFRGELNRIRAILDSWG
jgi:hypothetical protein